MLNLYDDKYTEKLLVTEQNILAIINEYSIYKLCVGDFEINKTFKSPLKTKDDHPSFGIFKSDKFKTLLFKDLSTGKKGSCFNLVQEMFNLSYSDSLHAIIKAFKLQDRFLNVKDVDFNLIGVKEESPLILNEKKIYIRIRQFEKHDINYWGRYGIELSTLRLFNVFPIEYYFVGDKIFKAHKYAYAYIELYDNDYRYKIYQPFETKEKKWFNDLMPDTISGVELLDLNKKEIIITSSKKDAMIIYEIGYNVINPQSESYSFNEDFIHFLKQTFESIYIFYDYDETGIKNAYKLKRLYGFIPIFTKSPKNKDISDYIYNGKINKEDRKKIFERFKSW